MEWMTDNTSAVSQGANGSGMRLVQYGKGTAGTTVTISPVKADKAYLRVWLLGSSLTSYSSIQYFGTYSYAFSAANAQGEVTSFTVDKWVVYQAYFAWEVWEYV